MLITLALFYFILAEDTTAPLNVLLIQGDPVKLRLNDLNTELKFSPGPGNTVSYEMVSEHGHSTGTAVYSPMHSPEGHSLYAYKPTMNEVLNYPTQDQGWHEYAHSPDHHHDYVHPHDHYHDYTVPQATYQSWTPPTVHYVPPVPVQNGQPPVFVPAHHHHDPAYVAPVAYLPEDQAHNQQPTALSALETTEGEKKGSKSKGKDGEEKKKSKSKDKNGSSSQNGERRNTKKNGASLYVIGSTAFISSLLILLI